MWTFNFDIFCDLLYEFDPGVLITSIYIVKGLHVCNTFNTFDDKSN